MESQSGSHKFASAWRVMVIAAGLASLVGCASPRTTATDAVAIATQEATATTAAVEATRTSPPPEDTPEPTQEPAQATSTPTAAPSQGTIDGTVNPGEYPGLVTSVGVSLYFRVEGDDLVAALTAPTTGWVSVGFDPEDGMAGADYVFGYVAEGETVAYDMYGTKPGGPDSHPPDTDLGGTDDLLELAGSEVDGTTTIEFRIPLDSGDAYDKPLGPGQTYVVLLAMGADDDVDSYHTARGETSITLNP
jgi:hypothetical protein